MSIIDFTPTLHNRSHPQQSLLALDPPPALIRPMPICPVTGQGVPSETLARAPQNTASTGPAHLTDLGLSQVRPVQWLAPQKKSVALGNSSHSKSGGGGWK